MSDIWAGTTFETRAECKQRQHIGDTGDMTTRETDIERISRLAGVDKTYVRAVVAAMMEPGEGMLKAAVPIAGHLARARVTNDYRAMLRHILDESRETEAA